MLVGVAETEKSSTINVRLTECLRQQGADLSNAVTAIVQVVIRVFLVVMAVKEAPPVGWLAESTMG